MNNIKLPENISKGKLLELNNDGIITNTSLNTTDVANTVAVNKRIYYITEEGLAGDWEDASNDTKQIIQEIINEIINNIDNPINYPTIYLLTSGTSTKYQYNSRKILYINAKQAQTTRANIKLIDNVNPEIRITYTSDNTPIIKSWPYTYTINLTSKTDATIVSTDADYEASNDYSFNYTLPVLTTNVQTSPSEVSYLPTQDSQAANKKYVDQQDNLLDEKITTLETKFTGVDTKLDTIIGDDSSEAPTPPTPTDPDGGDEEKPGGTETPGFNFGNGSDTGTVE